MTDRIYVLDHIENTHGYAFNLLTQGMPLRYFIGIGYAHNQSESGVCLLSKGVELCTVKK